ncbi:transition state regulator Abh [Bacillus marinisedimentorum]|uniref:transition state regulator Abh n=1 Tax=Bacillus marinisedimentorum TaxID=1821260 RepID=UPI001FE23AE4|nr:transition state regulator Abh [Bacillus marinisedimentorum]
METRRVFNNGLRDSLEIFVEEKRIILQRFESRNQCAVTGEVTLHGLKMAGGKINLSQEGARLLLNELQSALKEEGKTSNPDEKPPEEWRRFMRKRSFRLWKNSENK